jgi:hypothetical protein
MLKTSSIRLLTGGLILLNLLVPLADANAADAAAGQELASRVVRAGGKVVEGPEGVVSIDLFNGNNPTKGQGGPNEAVNDDWLACLEGCSSLRKLSLQNCAITNAGLVHLRGLTGLEELSLAFTPVSDEGLVHLAGMTSLRKLGLTATKCTGSGFKHLRSIRGLSDVNFHYTPLDDAGLKEIVATGVSGRLWIAHTRFTDAGAAHLTALKALRVCGLGSNAAGSSAAAVAFLKELPLLEDLSLLDFQADPAGILEATEIKTLRRLDLTYAPQVNDECLRKAAALPALEEILIGGPTLTREGVLALAACDSLKKITLGQMKQLTADDIEALRQQRPDIEVITR